jgi:hypothetical protein
VGVKLKVMIDHLGSMADHRNRIFCFLGKAVSVVSQWLVAVYLERSEQI